MNLHAVSSPWSSGEPRDSLEPDELMGRNFGEVQKEKNTGNLEKPVETKSAREVFI